MWTYLRHFFDLKYVFNRVAPVLLMLLLFHGSITSRFSRNWSLAPYPKREKRKSNLMLFSTSFCCCLCCCCLFVFLLSYFVFFFLNVENLVQISVKNRVPVHQSFTRKHNMHFYQLPVEWTWYNAIFIYTHSCSKINYNNENIKSKK